MTPLTEIGECLIGDGRREYFFRPSFAAMTRIGEPREIVRVFYDLHNTDPDVADIRSVIDGAVETFGCLPPYILKYINSYITRQVNDRTLTAASTIIRACCDDDVTPLTGELRQGKSGRKGMLWRCGKMSPEEMLLVAQSLILHGIIGRVKMRKLQRHESSATVGEFHAIEYINAARHHFGISRQEAENLTMTEFIMMLNTKYPSQHGFTREEYDSVVDEHFRRKELRLQKEREKNTK
ncbi:DUF6246 family protein [Entomohabitans teleogrylli]|uniref:DUF6246 family protein n=1 Tax=Entomohabitans teleogrylli TaxID=1384589 RepID=UPI00073D3D67|nr:DUF6246 family protein [Entomohabitans teleogrylli]